MRCLFYLLAIMAIIVAAAIFYNRVREDRWRPLPGGGEIRSLSVTFGKNNHYKTGGSIFAPLRERLGPHWGRFLGPSPLSADLPMEAPTMVVWFATRTHLELMLDEKQTSGSRVVLSTDTAGHALVGVTVDPAFDAARRLPIRVNKKGPPLEFDIENPRFSPAHADSKSPPAAKSQAVVLSVYEMEYATPVPAKPGYVTSPYAPESNPIDVRGFPPDTEVRCPYTQRILLVP